MNVGLSCPEREGLLGSNEWTTDEDILKRPRSDLGGDIGPEAIKELNLPTFTDPRTRGAEPEKLYLPAITPKKVEGSVESAFILSEALPVVPAKLVMWTMTKER